MTEKNEFCNLSIFTKISDSRIALNSINNELGRENNATFFAVNEFIKNNSETDLILDFEGSNIDSIRQRNVGFGATDEFYSYFKYRNFPIG